MAKRYLVNAIAGTLAERPDPSTPSGGASESPFGLYLDTGTGDFYESTGSAWTKIGTLTGSGGGSITDATTSAIGGVEVDHARSGAHSVALTTDGVALPAGMIGTTSTTACAGNNARLSDARTPTGAAGGGLAGTYPNPTLAYSLRTVTDTYAVLTTDQVILVGASTKTITLPDAATVTPGYAFDIKNTDAGDTTTVATAAGNIDGVATYTGLAAAKASARFVSDGANFWIL